MALVGLLTLACALSWSGGALAWIPQPPCPAPVPNAAVPEAWCSNALATNQTSGVIVSEFGLPENSTLVTASTDAAIWYDDALFFLGGGFSFILSYISGANSAKTSFVHNRTVPIAVRPINAASSPSNTWLTSMMLSPAAFPNRGPSDFPAPVYPNVSLELLGARTLATLVFEAQPRYPTSLLSPPYFTDFLTCDARLAAGLPEGWVLNVSSTWTPSWFYFQARGFNGTLTLQCAAEVSRSPASKSDKSEAEAAPATPKLRTQVMASPSQVLPRLNRTSLRSAASAIGAASICAVLLDFETVEWGAWAPPHAPAVQAPDVNGGTLGLAALDAGRGVQYLGTTTDAPFFGIQLAGLNLSSGALTRVGAPYFPAAPPGFTGVGGYYFTVAFDEALGGLLVGLTEIVKYGVLPAENGGWTVIAAVDPDNGSSVALTGDLTPALSSLPPVQFGLGALDPDTGIMWLVVDGGPELPPLARRESRLQARQYSPRHASARRTGSSAPALVGVPLSSSPSPVTAVESLPVILTEGGGFQVFSVAYATAAGALVTAECVFAVPNDLCEIHINAYPVNGSAAYRVGTVASGQVSPAAGQVTASPDGRTVTFGAVQSTAAFESAAIISVDVIARTVAVTLAAPDDEYDILVLSQCL